MMKRKKLFKFTLLAALSAIGVVLMSYIQFPYPMAPFLKIEFSDFVIVFTFMLFGFKEAIAVAVIKTLGDLLFRGAVGPYAVGQITAFVASLSYCIGLGIASHLIKREGLGWKVIKYSIVVLFVTTVLTVANYLFLTPIFLGEFSFLDMTNDSLAMFSGVNSYLLSIIILYVPFNLLKGSCVCFLSATIGETIKKIYHNKMNEKSDTDVVWEPKE